MDIADSSSPSLNLLGSGSVLHLPQQPAEMFE
jgi:hypothetical protein